MLVVLERQRRLLKDAAPFDVNLVRGVHEDVADCVVLEQRLERPETEYFVNDLLSDEKSRTIVRSVIALSHGLGMRVTAEGVETAEQAAWLLEEGCDRLQGHFLSPPMHVDHIRQFIATRKGRRGNGGGGRDATGIAIGQGGAG